MCVGGSDFNNFKMFLCGVCFILLATLVALVRAESPNIILILLLGEPTSRAEGNVLC